MQRARRPLRGAHKIALRADRVLRRCKIAKHFEVEIADDAFSFSRNPDSIAAEAALDGIYVLRTSLGAEAPRPQVVSSYKSLAGVERAFRAFNTDLDIRPIRHRTEQRVRAHVFLRMLSYYVTLHMERASHRSCSDDDKEAAAQAPHQPGGSSHALPRPRPKKLTATPDRLPVHSFKSLLADLGTIAATEFSRPRPTCPASISSRPLPRCSVEPSICSVSRTVSARVVRSPPSATRSRR